MPLFTRAVSHQSQIHSYNRLARRASHAISAASQLRRTRTLITRLPDDHLDDWDRLIDDLSQIEDLTLRMQKDGALLIEWQLS